jgi:hypothetical protein
VTPEGVELVGYAPTYLDGFRLHQGFQEDNYGLYAGEPIPVLRLRGFDAEPGDPLREGGRPCTSSS